MKMKSSGMMQYIVWSVIFSMQLICANNLDEWEVEVVIFHFSVKVEDFYYILMGSYDSRLGIRVNPICIKIFVLFYFVQLPVLWRSCSSGC